MDRRAPPAHAAGDEAAADGRQAAMLQRVAALTRTLHAALRELGYDKAVERAVSSLPDARQRLAYIAGLTGSAAERSLGAAERARAHLEELGAPARRLMAQWDGASGAQREAEESLRIAADMRGFLDRVADATGQANDALTEIILAQEFHDLTGQVIERVVRLAQDLERELVRLLVDFTPGRPAPAEEAGPRGPAVDAAARDDLVTSQAQVDELLESLGF